VNSVIGTILNLSAGSVRYFSRVLASLVQSQPPGPLYHPRNPLISLDFLRVLKLSTRKINTFPQEKSLDFVEQRTQWLTVNITYNNNVFTKYNHCDLLTVISLSLEYTVTISNSICLHTVYYCVYYTAAWNDAWTKTPIDNPRFRSWCVHVELRPRISYNDRWLMVAT